MNLLSQARRVLENEDPIRAAHKGSDFIFGNLYWKFKRHYELSIKDTNILFSALNRSVVQLNKRRFMTEKKIIRDILQELNSSDIFYDIGANTGLYSLFCAKNCSKVFSFEPYPPNVSLLNKDIARNQVSNVKIYDIALSDSDGSVSFSQPAEDHAGYGSASINPSNSNGSKINARAGDDLISSENLPLPNVIKIDVEGSEPLVIKGLEETLSETECRLIYCEVHLDNADIRPTIQDFNSGLKRIKTQFHKHGFSVDEYKLTRSSDVHLKCYKQ